MSVISRRLWDNCVDNVIPWIDHLIGDNDEFEFKISDIKKSMNNKVGGDIFDEITLGSFVSGFRSHMINRGYNVVIKIKDDIIVIGKQKKIKIPSRGFRLFNEKIKEINIKRESKENINPENITNFEKELLEQELLGKMIKIIDRPVSNARKKEQDEYIYRLVINKKKEIYENTGIIMSIRDVIENAIILGIDYVD